VVSCQLGVHPVTFEPIVWNVKRVVPLDAQLRPSGLADRWPPSPSQRPSPMPSQSRCPTPMGTLSCPPEKIS
jgi:hypothetical protein